MLTLAQWIARLTKGYIKFTGKQPDNLAKLKIKMEALQKVKDQKKVVDLRGDVLDPSQPILGGTQSGTKLSKEFQAGIMRATKSKPTELKLDKLRKDILKEIENRKKEDYLPDIIDPEDYGFSVSDDTWTDEVEELMQMLMRDNKAGGGLAGLLGEPTYADGGRTGFKGKKFDPTKRTFLKGLGAWPLFHLSVNILNGQNLLLRQVKL